MECVMSRSFGAARLVPITKAVHCFKLMLIEDRNQAQTEL
jgi:hypothetical protein